MVERVDAIRAADGQKSGRCEPTVEDFREGLADPVEICLASVVFKREHEQQASMCDGLRGCGYSRLGLRTRRCGSWLLLCEYMALRVIF